MAKCRNCNYFARMGSYAMCKNKDEEIDEDDNACTEFENDVMEYEGLQAVFAEQHERTLRRTMEVDFGTGK